MKKEVKYMKRHNDGFKTINSVIKFKSYSEKILHNNGGRIFKGLFFRSFFQRVNNTNKGKHSNEFQRKLDPLVTTFIFILRWGTPK